MKNRKQGMWYVLTVFFILSIWLNDSSLVYAQNSQSIDKAGLAKNLIVKIIGDNVSGAGIVVGQKGDTIFIATANHVVRSGRKEAQNLRVEFQFWPEVIEAKLLQKFDLDLDLAVLLVNLRKNSNMSLEEFEDSLPLDQVSYVSTLQGVAKCYPIGHPPGWNWYVPKTPPDIYEIVGERIWIDAPCDAGNSGGGLFDEQWRLIGMILQFNSPLCEAMSFDRIRETLERWRVEIDLKPVESSSLEPIVASTPKPTVIPTLIPTAIPTSESNATLKPSPKGKIQLRSEPMMVSDEEAQMVFEIDQNKRPRHYIENDYEDQGEVVVDLATGLMWQKSGSKDSMIYQRAQTYIDKLNRELFGGYNDWQLPTVAELISLLESEKQLNELYINPIFDKHQRWCWSYDRRSLASAWHVSFRNGHVGWYDLGYGNFYVRGVRSWQPSSLPSKGEPTAKPTLEGSPTPISPKQGDVWTEPITGMEFVWIPGGCFQMGQTQKEKQWLLQDEGAEESYKEAIADELPRHRVCVDGFWMEKYEVTNTQYRKWKPTHDSTDYEGYSLNDDNQPVVYVSWEDANTFTEWLTKQYQENPPLPLSGGESYTFRLPTETEWEYAARAGTVTAWFWGDDPNQACHYANVYDQTSRQNLKLERSYQECDDGYTVTSPVGSFSPNLFGLYDMLGNVWEWCQDWYGNEYYAKSSSKNPQGPFSGTYRTNRGGGWRRYAGRCRSASRFSELPDDRSSFTGFRLVRTP